MRAQVTAHGARWLRRFGVPVALALVLVVSASAAQFGQRGGGRGGRGRPGNNFPRLGTNTSTWDRPARFDDFDGSFQFCRLQFRNGSNGDGGGWGVDWPRADQNLSIRLSELTRTPVSMNETDEPNSLLIQATSPEISRCPFVMMTEPGGAFFDDQEAAALRTYLLKGGFLWADDFWGSYAWDYWENELRKVLPSGQYAIYDVPLSHPVFHEMMTVPKIPQIPSIGFWQSRRSTSERQGDSAVPHVRAINDANGRIMVLMTHNTDFGDAYEREGDDHEYFERFSVPGYAFGVNVLLYMMSH
jgi:hypothetical protein